MKADNLGIEVSVKAKMTVDKQTANGCLYLVQIYCNDPAHGFEPNCRKTERATSPS